MKYLIEEALVDPFRTNIYGDNSLILSAMYGHLEVVKYLRVIVKITILYGTSFYLLLDG